MTITTTRTSSSSPICDWSPPAARSSATSVTPGSWGSTNCGPCSSAPRTSTRRSPARAPETGVGLTENWWPFLLVRPCGMPFVEEILADLRGLALLPDGQTMVQGWRELSRRLYFDQYGAAGTPCRLQDGAEAWLATTVARDADQTQRMTVACGLADYKQHFRQRRRAQRSQISLTYTSGEHSWPVFFDGIHVPETQPDRIRWELDLIATHAQDEPQPGCARSRCA